MDRGLGRAVVFDGGKKIHDSDDSFLGEKKRRITKAQFTEEWNRLDDEGRKRLMMTTIPVAE